MTLRFYVTTAVASEAAETLPEPFVAVTTTLMVEPTSAATGAYVPDVAPTMSAQLAPPASHRCHWKAKLVGAPSHEPVPAVRSCPSWGAPETVGGDVLVGAPAAATTLVGAETADAVPAAFRTLSFTRSVVPTSIAVIAYDSAAAPAMLAQFAPATSQRCHWYVKIDGLCVQVPVAAVSNCPTTGAPEIEGGAMFRGASSAAILPATIFASRVIVESASRRPGSPKAGT